MSDGGNIHVGDVETLVNAQTDEPGAAPAAPTADDDTLRKGMDRVKRLRARTRARGFDD